MSEYTKKTRLPVVIHKATARFWGGYACRMMLLVMVLWASWPVTGCDKKSRQEDYLIRIGNHVVTVPEFNQEVEAASEEVFPGGAENDPGAVNDLRARVLNQITEELIIGQRAVQLGITVTQKELDEAIEAIKADYPDDTFKETLLENAVSYDVWKKKMAARLLTEKVIAHELVDPVQITPQDVADYYQTHYPQGTPEHEDAQGLNKKIVKHLRKQKAEQAYRQWIDSLHQAFPVDINREQWRRLYGSD